MSAAPIPGTFLEEGPGGIPPIAGVATSIAAFVDTFSTGPLDQAVRISSFTDFERELGGLDETSEASWGIRQFFLNGGTEAYAVRVPSAAFDTALLGSREAKTGLYALEDVDLFNILCLPATAQLGDDQMRATWVEAAAYCEERRAFLIVDPPARVTSPAGLEAWLAANETLRHRNAAAYVPRVLVSDPLNPGRRREVGASGTMAGVYARTDAAHGVWKAPAGTEAVLRGVEGPTSSLSDAESAALAVLGVNPLRSFQGVGTVAWGARTLDGADQRASEWKYVPVRRLALFLEESLSRGTTWAIFEPQRRDAVDPAPAERRELPAGPVHQGRPPGADAGRGLLRPVRRSHHDPGGRRPRRRQRGRRLRAAQARRVRDRPDRAGGGTAPARPMRPGPSPQSS